MIREKGGGGLAKRFNCMTARELRDKYYKSIKENLTTDSQHLATVPQLHSIAKACALIDNENTVRVLENLWDDVVDTEAREEIQSDIDRLLDIRDQIKEL